MSDEKNILSPVKQNEEANNLFPIFLKLEQLSILIVGGGKIGVEKLNAVLLNSPATQVKIVATVVSDELKNIASEYPNIHISERPFEKSDVIGVDAVIIAIDN